MTNSITFLNPVPVAVRFRVQFRVLHATSSRGNNSETGLRRFNTQPTKVGFVVVGSIFNHQLRVRLPGLEYHVCYFRHIQRVSYVTVAYA